jgi:hypothetical protein
MKEILAPIFRDKSLAQAEQYAKLSYFATVYENKHPLIRAFLVYEGSNGQSIKADLYSVLLILLNLEDNEEYLEEPQKDDMINVEKQLLTKFQSDFREYTRGVNGDDDETKDETRVLRYLNTIMDKEDIQLQYIKLNNISLVSFILSIAKPGIRFTL